MRRPPADAAASPAAEGPGRDAPANDELRRLRACVRDVVALSAVPAMWEGRDPAAIAGDMAELVLSMGRLEFAYVRVDRRDDGPIEAARVRGALGGADPVQIARRLAPRLGAAPSPEAFELDGVGADRPMRSVLIPIGVGAALGVVAAGSTSPDFPSDVDVLLLRVAANQAAMTLRHARLLAEAQRAEELARRSSEQARAASEAHRRLASAAVAIARHRDLQEILDEITAQARGLLQAQAAAASLGAEGDARPSPGGGLAAPLVSRSGATIGWIRASDKAAGEFGPDDEAVLVQLAHMASAAIDNVRLYAEAERAQREAEQANRAKSDFLANMSHELRTPLNAIGGYTTLLEMGLRGPVTPEQLADLQRIRRSQEYLLGLINDVLNFAKLEAGHVALDVTDVDVSQVLDAMEELIGPQIAAKQLRYACARPREPLVARADREKVVQVLLNLLANAVKFTPAGGEVQIGCDADAAVVRLRVRDTGIGVPADKLAAIFDPFVQVPRTLHAQREGVGLGLAISRDLARAMGGDLVADSTLGAGSTFTLSLPRAAGGPPSSG